MHLLLCVAAAVVDVPLTAAERPRMRSSGCGGGGGGYLISLSVQQQHSASSRAVTVIDRIRPSASTAPDDVRRHTDRRSRAAAAAAAFTSVWRGHQLA